MICNVLWCCDMWLIASNRWVIYILFNFIVKNKIKYKICVQNGGISIM